MELKRRSPFHPTYVIGYANGSIGYVPTPEAFPVRANDALFHRAIALASLAGAGELRRRTGRVELVLSGGVFQNTLLLGIDLERSHVAAPEICVDRTHADAACVILSLSKNLLAVGQVYFQDEVM